MNASRNLAPLAIALTAISLSCVAQEPARERSEASQAFAVPSRTGSKLPTDQAQAALDFHNDMRDKHGVPALQWSTELSAVAQEWAEHLASRRQCGLQHMSNNRYGENLFGGRGRDYSALFASQRWYSEIDDFRYGPLSADQVHGVGHYTQMIWRTTTHVGIGVARCPNGAQVIAAEYDPPGNYIGQAPY